MTTDVTYHQVTVTGVHSVRGAGLLGAGTQLYSLRYSGTERCSVVPKVRGAFLLVVRALFGAYEVLYQYDMLYSE